MKFIDEAKIQISSGHGGPGSVSFRREAFAPRGGPDGGDGGYGGNVLFVSSSQLSTLQDFKFKRIYQAQNGMHGSGGNKSGKQGDDIIIRVPVGTVVKDTLTSEILADFVEDAQEWLACKGGRGGKGNAHFATSTHQAPRFAQPGEDGESREVTLELKLLADVGIIGFPNAGKSTLISRISAAHPKIADYPFTTLTPSLGVVSRPDLNSFVVADIPGLVEGAHNGKGLGHRFLKHIERTKLFVHLIDCTPILEALTSDDSQEASQTAAQTVGETAGMQLIKLYQVIRNELQLYSEKLNHKPEIVVLNKADLLSSDPEVLQEARKMLRDSIASTRGSHPLPAEPLIISAVSGQGIEELIFAIHEELATCNEKSRLKSDSVHLPDDQGLRR